ncbi:MAG: flagellar M-ring protein FliF [Myxococcota bacterium]
MKLQRLTCFLFASAVWVTGCRSQIQQSLDERQANELQTVLVERGFDARKVPVSGKKPAWAVEVPNEQASDAVRVLAELGLPRATVPTTMDVLGRGGLVPTPAEERARMVVGLAGDLARTLESLDGVASAHVHLVLPPPARSGQAPVEAKASALVRASPGAAARVTQIREELKALIAGGVEGLTAGNVTLVVSEVATHVQSPVAGSSPVTRLRVLLTAMGITVSVLAVVMVLLTLRIRHFRNLVTRASPTAKPQPSPPPHVARRAA